MNRKRGMMEVHNEVPIKMPYLEKALESWSPKDVRDYLEKKGVQLFKSFEERKVAGRQLLSLSDKDLYDMGYREIKDLLHFREVVKDMLNQNGLTLMETTKIFNDPIHGHIEMHPLCVKIIDTPQFQRLRSLKQLGGCYWVYPGASHNRFEHSLGVCYLAGQLVRKLMETQPELNIDNKDVLCVEIAGLCHDLGHGPFSHMFDNMFIPKASKGGKKIKHESLSLKMFDHLRKENNLQAAFEEYDLDEKDIIFIKELINSGKSLVEGEPVKGRNKEKHFLYEIVANKKTGIDVDKWDYFSRDCHALGIKNNFDHTRFVKFARVLKVEDEFHIGVREKEVDNVYEMFNTRKTLHKRAYQHRVSNVIEIMITDALLEADEHIRFQGKDRALKMSECIEDMEAYSKLNDSVFDQILNSSDEKLAPAKKILERITRRQLYASIGETKIKKKQDEDQMKTQILAICQTPKPLKEEIELDFVEINYGMKDKNPVEEMYFYRKQKVLEAYVIRKKAVSEMLPEKFSDVFVRLVCKIDDEEKKNNLHGAFVKWCEDKEYPLLRGDSSDLTPYKTFPNEAKNMANTKAVKRIL